MPEEDQNAKTQQHMEKVAHDVAMRMEKLKRDMGSRMEQLRRNMESHIERLKIETGKSVSSGQHPPSTVTSSESVQVQHEQGRPPPDSGSGASSSSSSSSSKTAPPHHAVSATAAAVAPREYSSGDFFEALSTKATLPLTPPLSPTEEELLPATNPAVTAASATAAGAARAAAAAAASTESAASTRAHPFGATRKDDAKAAPPVAGKTGVSGETKWKMAASRISSCSTSTGGEAHPEEKEAALSEHSPISPPTPSTFESLLPLPPFPGAVLPTEAQQSVEAADSPEAEQQWSEVAEGPEAKEAAMKAKALVATFMILNRDALKEALALRNTQDSTSKASAKRDSRHGELHDPKRPRRQASHSKR